MNILTINRLDKTNLAKSTIYGNKIGNLSTLVAKDINIPDGYYFTVNSSRGSESKLNTQVQQIFNSLKKTDETKLIVRSSMSVEDQITHQFPGIFLSRKNILTNTELAEAIKDCIKSKNSQLADRYVANLRSVMKRDIKVSILVQKQIPIKYSWFSRN